MTAQEAAELEAVEVFVEMMAALSRMEEREEIARFSEDHTGLGKRWEARRELVGKPRPAKHSVEKVVHGKRPALKKPRTSLPSRATSSEKNTRPVSEKSHARRSLPATTRRTMPTIKPR